MRTIAIASLACAAVLGAAVAARAAERATVVTRHDFKVAAHPTIAVDSAGGSVELAAGPAGAVHVEAERRADSDEVARKLDVRVELDGNTVRVRFRHDGGVHNASVHFRISAPADAKLEVRTGGGAVAARGFAAGVDVETGGGAIEIAGATGALHLRSGGGSIEVDKVAGSVDIDTGGGSIHVVGALRGKNRIGTGGGSIHVAIPADSKLAVDASTGAGGAHNDFGLPSDGRGRFRGTIGDGSAGSLELRTGGGSISLERS